MADSREEFLMKQTAKTGEYWPKEGEKTTSEHVRDNFAIAAQQYLDAIENLDYFGILEDINIIDKWIVDSTKIIEDIIFYLESDYVQPEKYE